MKTDRLRRLRLAVAVALLLAAPAAGGGAEAVCEPRVGEKLGLQFVAVDLPGKARFALACRAPEPGRRTPPVVGGAVAGFRCVLPTWALATFQPAAPD